MQIVLDIETTYTIENKRKNPSPYLDTNKLVSVGYKQVDGEEEGYLMFNHNEVEHSTYLESCKALHDVLKRSTLIIGHNLKFDMSWLYQCGFSYDEALWDTMIAEYVFAKGQKIPLSLAASCERRGVSAKSDILMEYFDKGFNTNEIPLVDLVSYGRQDILSTKELYEAQQAEIVNNPEYAYMQKAVHLMNCTLPALIDMERNGIFIDLQELANVEKQYRDEYNTLQTQLQQIIVDVMGHTPINLDSPEHLSWVIYSRKVKDKNLWKDLFNLGSEVRNSVVKVKHSRYMKQEVFNRVVKQNTEKLYKTEAKQCEACLGKGKILKVKKDGSSFKKETICKECHGAGFHYLSTGKYAGFKLSPINSEYASTGGFSTDKTTLSVLLQDPALTPQAREFLTALLRINAISTYLTTFVEGIKKNVKCNILHTNFNQCITATGRLSSSNPNFQNLPRAKTFPIRRVIKSRFEGGKVFSVDFKQLEFRVAAMLANDLQAIEDIINQVDIHIFTRDTITAAGQPMDRQEAKIRTFKPLFGGLSGTEAEVAYYKAFLIKYNGIDAWQKVLETEALNTYQIKSPSGRIYAFPHVRRMPNGTVLGHTQIKNYIVQGFATGDICPVALIEIYHRMKGMKSKLILNVHDDVTIDVYPDEIERIVGMVKEIFSNMNTFIEDWFGVVTRVPIEGDFSIGANWLEKEAI